MSDQINFDEGTIITLKIKINQYFKSQIKSSSLKYYLIKNIKQLTI